MRIKLDQVGRALGVGEDLDRACNSRARERGQKAQAQMWDVPEEGGGKLWVWVLQFL